MTESGGTGASGWNSRSQADDATSGPLPPPLDPQPPVPPAAGAEPSPAMPSESVLTPSPDADAGTLIPDQLHDAPAYIPPPVGMTPGGMLPPQNPADVPTSAWITTAPPVQAGSGRRRGLVSIIVGIIGILVVGATVAGILGLLPSDKGKVLFGTAAGKDLCSVANPVTTVKTTDPIFFAAVLKHKMDGAQAITFHITKDGQEFVSHDEPADGTAFDCYGNRESLGALEAGTYVFQVIHNGEIEATGTLKVE